MLRNVFFLLALVALFTSVLSTPAPSDLEVRSVPSFSELLQARGGHKQKEAANATGLASTNTTSTGKKHKGNKGAADLAASNSTTQGHKSKKNGTANALDSDAKRNSTRKEKSQKAEKAEKAKSTATATSTSAASTATATTSMGIRVEAWSSFMVGLTVALGSCLL